MVSRRNLLGMCTASLVAPLLPARASVGLDVERLLVTHGLPGLSVAVGVRGRIRYRAAWGIAGLDTLLEPHHRFRLASVSKPITAVAILVLVERGRLGLDTRLVDVLPTVPSLRDQRVKQVTIEQLLRHTAGGWPNDDSDPMQGFPTLSQAELLSVVLRTRALDAEPGTAHRYSNFGYFLLGRVIEAVTGSAYADFVQKAVLDRAGAELVVARNARAQRAPNEVVYFEREGDQHPYSFDVSRMDAHGGWVGSPEQVVRFLMALQSGRLLSRSTRKQMLAPTTASLHYGLGWNVNRVGNAWHMGALPGVTALAATIHDGWCWAACANGRSATSARALDRFMWRLREILETQPD